MDLSQAEVEALAQRIHSTADFDAKVALMRTVPRAQQRAVEVAMARLELADGAGEKRTGHRISDVGDRSSGVLTCPKCGGAQFKAKRSRGAKIALGATVGVGALLAKKTRVKCETCGTEYLRG